MLFKVFIFCLNIVEQIFNSVPLCFFLFLNIVEQICFQQCSSLLLSIPEYCGTNMCSTVFLFASFYSWILWNKYVFNSVPLCFFLFLNIVEQICAQQCSSLLISIPEYCGTNMCSTVFRFASFYSWILWNKYVFNSVHLCFFLQYSWIFWNNNLYSEVFFLAICIP